MTRSRGRAIPRCHPLIRCNKRAEETWQSLYQAIDALPLEQKAVIIATEIQGHSYRELAEAWGVPMGTLLARKARGLKTMRASLARLLVGGFGLGRVKGHSSTRDARRGQGAGGEVMAGSAPSAPCPGDYGRYWHEEGRAAFAAYLQRQEQARSE